MFSKLLLGLILPAAALASGDGVERQHGAHVHGEGIATVAQEGDRFELELELPGANIAGFEHVPRDAEQEAMIEQAREWLRDGANWLTPDPRGECAVASLDAHTHGYDDDHAGHEDDHDHEHAEFHVAATLQCGRAGRLRWLDLALFERFPGNEVLVVNIFTDRGQAQARLDRGNIRIALR